MANTVTTRTLVDGPRTAVIHVYLKCDGASGELTDQVIVTAANLAGAPAKLTVEQIWTQFVGFDAMLEFDATTDTALWKVGQTYGPDHADFRCFGGIKDNSGTGTTGNILLTTAGFTAATDEGTLIIQVKKD